MSRARIGDGGSTSCARAGAEPRLAAGRRKRWLRAIGAPVIALALACAACSDGASTSARERSSSLAPDEPQHALTAADLASFRPGRARREIQAELGGRVGRAWLVDCGDRRLGTLGFELISAGDSDRRSGLRFDALFEGDRFVKLVERPYDEPGPAMVDDCAWLARALEWPALDAAELEERARSLAQRVEHVDWGLTAAYLVLSPFLSDRTDRSPSADDYGRNAALREQLDAARLDLGMTEAEVEVALRASPLARGPTIGGTFCVYGSRDVLPLDDAVLHRNVLVVYREGRATVVESIGDVDAWLRDVAGVFR